MTRFVWSLSHIQFVLRNMQGAEDLAKLEVSFNLDLGKKAVDCLVVVPELNHLIVICGIRVYFAASCGSNAR